MDSAEVIIDSAISTEPSIPAISPTIPPTAAKTPTVLQEERRKIIQNNPQTDVKIFFILHRPLLDFLISHQA